MQDTITSPFLSSWLDVLDSKAAAGRLDASCPCSALAAGQRRSLYERPNKTQKRIDFLCFSIVCFSGLSKFSILLCRPWAWPGLAKSCDEGWKIVFSLSARVLKSYEPKKAIAPLLLYYSFCSLAAIADKK